MYIEAGEREERKGMLKWKTIEFDDVVLRSYGLTVANIKLCVCPNYFDNEWCGRRRADPHREEEREDRKRIDEKLFPPIYWHMIGKPNELFRLLSAPSVSVFAGFFTAVSRST